MIKSGWTHILTLRDGQRRVVFVSGVSDRRIQASEPREIVGHYLVPPPHRRRQEANADGSYRFMVYHPEHWQPVCEGRHSNPEELLTDPEPLVQKGDVRKGRATAARYEVLGVHGDQVWTYTHGGGTGKFAPVESGYTSWSLENFLESTVEMSVFFEEGRDYEYLHGAGPRLRVTIRAVGKMPKGAVYAVGERRNGMRQGDPILLTQDDFKRYGDVTR